MTHIHEMKIHDHKSNPKSGNTSLKCMYHQNQVIQAHFMGSNKHSSTNINRFICGPRYVQV